MKYGHLVFSVVRHKDGTLAHHLWVGPLLVNFGFHYVTDQFLRADEYLGCTRELLDIFKVEVMKLAFIIFHIQDGGAYPLGFDDPPDAHIW